MDTMLTAVGVIIYTLTVVYCGWCLAWRAWTRQRERDEARASQSRRILLGLDRGARK